MSKVLMTEEEFMALAAQSTLTKRSVKIGRYLLVEGHTGREASEKFGIAHQRAYAISQTIKGIGKEDLETYITRRIENAIEEAPEALQKQIRVRLRPLGLFARRA